MAQQQAKYLGHVIGPSRVRGMFSFYTHLWTTSSLTCSPWGNVVSHYHNPRRRCFISWTKPSRPDINKFIGDRAVFISPLYTSLETLSHDAGDSLLPK
ncbi:hypothetical protein Bpfe_012108 [Biomphalaria pfeifferi]|uniref:Uncharacterized protein n=1 Tax=Biomphalaria pfeifferi TaxID=112525 RepID=A0AAD8BPK7_BIOPF|nr:hypothetical protein Bpfe_012108 [Biomphalaria pfeifferi]